MKKVININFQGQVIAIEETAYEILKQYIESLKNYFAREEGGDEIVNDIENRIAELFGNRLKLGISCITDEDVESIISSIGRPEDFDSNYEEASESYERIHMNADSQKTHSENQSAPNEEPRTLNRNNNDKIIAGVCSGLAHYFKMDPVWMRIIFLLLFSVLFWVYLILWIVLKPANLDTNIAKRLYRNPTDKLLGGVCGGIAAYFKIDSWIPRVLFLVPFMLNVMGMISIPFFPWNRIFDDVDFNWSINLGVVIFYGVLWIIIPKAVSVKQKLEMMGEEAYIKSIRETVSENVANVKSKTDNEDAQETFASNHFAATQSQEYEKVKTKVNMPPEPPKVSHNPTSSSSSERSGCLNALVIFLKIIFFAFVSVFALALVSALGAMLFAGTKIIPLKSLIIESGFENRLLWVSLILLLVVPFISIVIWIVRRLIKAKSRPIIGFTTAGLWLVGLVTAGVLTFRIVEKFQNASSVEKIQTLQPFSGNKLYVDMDIYPSDYYLFNGGFGPDLDWDNLPYYNLNEDSLLFSNIELEIVKSTDSLFHVKTIAVSSDRNLKTAKQNAQQFSYVVQQRDSLLLLPEFFSVPISQGFRLQAMLVEIAVPAGKKIEINDELSQYESFKYYSPSIRKIMKRSRRNSQTYDWDYGEEYIIQNGELRNASPTTLRRAERTNKQPQEALNDSTLTTDSI